MSSNWKATITYVRDWIVYSFIASPHSPTNNPRHRPPPTTTTPSTATVRAPATTSGNQRAGSSAALETRRPDGTGDGPIGNGPGGEPLTIDQVLALQAKTNPFSILIYHKGQGGEKQPMSKFGWAKFYQWLITHIHTMEMATAADPGAPVVRLAAHGYHKDHGVLVPRDKATMVALIALIPEIGEYTRDGAGNLQVVPGVEGKQVGAWPVRDPETNAVLEPMSTILRLWYPESLVDPEQNPQDLLNLALKKSGILPGTEAFGGAEAFYWCPKTPNVLCFLASYATVVAIMSDRRAQFGCPAGRLYAGVTAQPVYYRNKKIDPKKDMEYGHYTLVPSYWPKPAEEEDEN